jgi:hypothetical protein
MRQINLADLDARLDPRQAGRVTREFSTHMLNQQGAWLDREFKRILPPDIYRMAYDESGTNDEFIARQEAVKKWLDSHDIRVEQHGIHARLFRGKEKIGSFFVKLAEK